MLMKNCMSRSIYCKLQQLIRELIFQKSIEFLSKSYAAIYYGNASRPMIVETRLFNYRALRTDVVRKITNTHRPSDGVVSVSPSGGSTIGCSVKPPGKIEREREISSLICFLSNSRHCCATVAHRVRDFPSGAALGRNGSWLNRLIGNQTLL